MLSGSPDSIEEIISNNNNNIVTNNLEETEIADFSMENNFSRSFGVRKRRRTVSPLRQSNSIIDDFEGSHGISRADLKTTDSSRRITRGKRHDFARFYEDAVTFTTEDDEFENRPRKQRNSSKRHLGVEATRVLPARSTRFHGRVFDYDDYDDDEDYRIRKPIISSRPKISIPKEKLDAIKHQPILTRNQARAIIELDNEEERDRDGASDRSDHNENTDIVKNQDPSEYPEESDSERPSEKSGENEAQKFSEPESNADENQDYQVQAQVELYEDEYNKGYSLRPKRAFRRLVPFSDDNSKDDKDTKQYELRPRTEPKNYQVRIPLYDASPSKDHKKRNETRFSSIRRLARSNRFENFMNREFETVLLGPDIDSEDDTKDDEKVRNKINHLLGKQSLGTKPMPGGSKFSDIDPIKIDSDIDFNCVGGLDDHIKSLKEMVILPLFYPEIFSRFGVTPPRGVLFHGPPGTGKTLMARALACACSNGNQKVSFFMRKGADVLSKWVGESERQLKLLFEQARSMQPSIIFFDELDGLAPVRSSKQDQIHSSIVTTLLALMDGLDSRGQVILIGATNRIDSIDPALRRPGRFDREFLFQLPDIKARKNIIRIHTRKWNPPLEDDLVEKLSDATKGFSGSDIQSLCAEATFRAIERKYPQVYTNEKRLMIDASAIQVEAADFISSIQKIVSTGQRSAGSEFKPLRYPYFILLERFFKKLEKVSSDKLPFKNPNKFFPDLYSNSFEEGSDIRTDFMCHPRLLIHSDDLEALDLVSSSLVSNYDGYPSYIFDVNTIYSDLYPDSALINFFKESFRLQPSILFIRRLDVIWKTLNDISKMLFLSAITCSSRNKGVYIIATSLSLNGNINDDEEDENPFTLFTEDDKLEILLPSRDERRSFFVEFYSRCTQAFSMIAFDINSESFLLKEPKEQKEEIKVAEDAPPKSLTLREIKILHDYDESVFRKLRLTIREFLHEWIRCKEYKALVKGLHPVEDYADVVTLDAHEILEKLEMGNYKTVKPFKTDMLEMLESFKTLAELRGENFRISYANALFDIFSEWYSNFDADLARDAKECALREEQLKADYEKLKAQQSEEEKDMEDVEEKEEEEGQQKQDSKDEEQEMEDNVNSRPRTYENETDANDSLEEESESHYNKENGQKSEVEVKSETETKEPVPEFMEAVSYDDATTQERSPEEKKQDKVFLPRIAIFSKRAFVHFCEKLVDKTEGYSFGSIQQIYSKLNRCLIEFRKTILDRITYSVAQNEKTGLDLLEELQECINKL